MTTTFDDEMDRPANPLAQAQGSPLAQAQGAAVEMVKSRAAMEVMAAMAHAKRHPRDEAAAYARIMQACKRPGLAQESQYSYTKGGSAIEGPSIRLAEAVAQAWGNIATGIIELEQRDGESEMMAYAWDMETNYRVDKVFRVPHVRVSNQGKTRKDLTDPRDVYETTANQGSRRLRACILAVVPKDVTDDAVAECNKTLTSGNSEPLADQVRKVAKAFGEVGVTVAMLEAKIGHKLDTMTPLEVARLRKVYAAIRDGFGSVEDHFTVGGAAPAGNAASVADLKTKLGADVEKMGDELAETVTKKKPAPKPAPGNPDPNMGWN